MTDTKHEQILLKRQQAQDLMRRLEIPAWITFVADNKAESNHLPIIGAPEGACPKAYVLTQDRAVAFCPEIEAEGQEKAGFETIRTPGRSVIRPVAEGLSSIIGEVKGPIALNFSTQFSNVDTIGHGTYMRFVDALREIGFYPEGYDGDRFVPADELIFTAASEKLPFELEALEKAAQLTDLVLRNGFGRIEAGMTEQDVAGIFHGLVDKLRGTHPSVGYSWPVSMNPIVLTGEGIAGSPHAVPSDRVIEPGSTVYVDFGLAVDGYSGDLQHMGYVLKPGEVGAPQNVTDMYHFLVKSIMEGMKAAVPGALGRDVDKACRDVIVGADFPSYEHGTGHQLGCEAHAPGVSFGPKFVDYTNEGDEEKRADELNPYSSLVLKEGYVMTIEPRIQVANGASIEVDGVVTREGFELFAPIQERVHLIF